MLDWALEDEFGHTQACMCAAVTFFFDRRDDDAFCRALDVTLRYLQPHAHWGVESGRVSKFTKRHINTFKSWFTKSKPIPDPDGFDFSIQGSVDSKDRVSPWQLDFWLTQREVKPKKRGQPWTFAPVGFWQVFVPPSFAMEEPGAFLEIFTDLADVLPYRSAHAGWMVNLSSTNLSDSNAAEVLTLLEQRPTIDVNSECFILKHVANRLKTLSWITVLDQELASHLDSGLDAPPAGVMVSHRGDKTMIRLHEHLRSWNEPTAGGIDAYRWLAGLSRDLRPSRAAQESGCPFPKKDRPRYRSWMRRFDG